MAAHVTDLRDVAVVDNHCHGVERGAGRAGVASFRSLFSESPDPAMRTQAVAHTAFYQRLIAAMGRFLDVPADEAAVLVARGEHDDAALAQRLLTDADVGALVVDTGFPDPDGCVPVAELGVDVVLLLRLELLFQRLVATTASLDDLLEMTRFELSSLRDKGFVGLKSIAGYRTGLDVRRWDRSDVLPAHAAARREVDATDAVRLGHKPLLDTLLHVAFEAAAAQRLPVQFHVGYGDPDADLRSAHPLLLRDVLEEPAYRDMPVVLLHGCWPYVREGAYLAAVYGNAFLDLSYGIPFMSKPEMRSVTRAALGAAPTSKLMYSSDGSRVAELHWMGAHDGRQIVGEALGELVDDGDLTAAQARRAGEQVLRDNARELYGLAGAS